MEWVATVCQRIHVFKRWFKWLNTPKVFSSFYMYDYIIPYLSVVPIIGTLVQQPSIYDTMRPGWTTLAGARNPAHSISQERKSVSAQFIVTNLNAIILSILFSASPMYPYPELISILSWYCCLNYECVYVLFIAMYFYFVTGHHGRIL